MVNRIPVFLERCAGEIPGAQIGDGVFTKGPAIWSGTREVAHFHDESGELEVRLTKPVVRARRADLKSDPRVTLRRSASDWVSFAIAVPADEDDALELVRVAIDANALTAPAGPPPSGADLARRRRFH